MKKNQKSSCYLLKVFVKFFKKKFFGGGYSPLNPDWINVNQSLV